MCVMGTWNYPMLTLFCPASNVIAAGNCAVLKPSELAPHSAITICKLIDNYLDNRYFRSILGKTNVAVTLSSMLFDQFVFTGSTAKGKLLA